MTWWCPAPRKRGQWEPPQKQKVSINNNVDHIFKAKHHNNHSKDVNTFAESTKTKYYMFGFLHADEGRR